MIHGKHMTAGTARAHDYLHIADIQVAEQIIVLGLSIPSALLLLRSYGVGCLLRFMGGLIPALLVQHIFLVRLLNRTGHQQASLADALTLSRATVAALLAGLAASGRTTRTSSEGRLGWIAVLLSATLTDWIDGPLARAAGPTTLGKVLDIEADSWLTFWSAVAAIRWARLPAYSLLPPALRYLYPLLCYRHGLLPEGSHRWWERVTGSAQMALFLVALAPLQSSTRDRLLEIVALPITLAQLLAVLAALQITSSELSTRTIRPTI